MHNNGVIIRDFLGARGLLNLGKKHLDHQNWENLMQSKRTGPPFEMD